MRINFLILIIPLNILLSQLRLPVNDSVQNFLFAKSSLNNPLLITVNGIFEYKNDWKYTPFIDNIFKKEIDKLDELNHANFFTKLIRNELYIISNGAGPVFKKSKNSFERIDNSTLHKNQFGGARFVYNDKIHIYGGYGFWSFKNFITFFDHNIKQWDLLYNDSEYLPPGRWKPIYNLFDDKLYVLGGRASSFEIKNQDVSYSDIFYFDLMDKNFVKLGQISSELETKYSLFAQPKSGSNTFIINKDKLTIIDFKLLEVTSYYKKDFFLGVDNKYPTFLDDQSLFFISNLNGIKYLNFFDLELVNENYKSHTYSLISENNEIPVKQYLLFGIIISLLFWVILKIFSFKDFIKGLLLYDDNTIYYNNNSISISKNEQKLISHLSKNIFITANQVNFLISNQNYAKSHFTTLRNNLVAGLNKKLFKLTDKNNFVIETKSPMDNRVKIYKIDSSLIKRKVSFMRFLFKS